MSDLQTTEKVDGLIQQAVEAEADTVDGIRRTGDLLNKAFAGCPHGRWEERLRANGWRKSLRWAAFFRAVARDWDRLAAKGFDPGEVQSLAEIRRELENLNEDRNENYSKTELQFRNGNSNKETTESAKEGEKSTVAAPPTRGPDIPQAAGAGGNGRAKLGGGVPTPAVKGEGAGIAGLTASPAAKPRPESDVIDVEVWRRENAAYRIVERLKVTLSTMEADFTKLFAGAAGADVRERLCRMLHNKDIVAVLADVRTAVKLYGPQWPCPIPHKGASCSQCKNRGYVNEEQYKALPPELIRRLGGKTK